MFALNRKRGASPAAKFRLSPAHPFTCSPAHSLRMSYILNTPADQRAMLEAIGVSSIDELLTQVPAELRLGRELKIPPALSELELTAHVGQLAAQNTACGQKACFLGGGSYDH